MSFSSSDSREICLVHANCLGDPLIRLLLTSPVFSDRYQVCRVTNYTHEPVADHILKKCSLFLYQHLSAKWEQAASDYLLARLPASARAIRLPVPVFRGYWPLWTNAFPMNFADALLERLALTGLDASEIIALYMKRGALAGWDLDSPAEESLNRLRAAEARGAVPIADFIETFWREFPVFDTINHPSPPLLRHIADGVLAALDLPPLDEKARRLAVSCDEGGHVRFELPIHPQVAAHHGLSFGDSNRLYRIYGTKMTFARYVACYVDCRLLGLSDFASYLRQIAEQAAGGA